MRQVARRLVSGVFKWLRPGEEERRERLLEDSEALGVTELGTGIVRQLYACLLPRLAGKINVLPCFRYTPRCLGIAPQSCSPPRESRPILAEEQSLATA